ncbi:MAG: cupredoxin domain-containing protein [Candidatus Aenigmatarchaeota archaeon]
MLYHKGKLTTNKFYLAVIVILIAIAISISLTFSGILKVEQPKKTQESPSEPTTKTFTVTIYHTSYIPSTFTVNKGDTVRILAVTAPGTASHNHGITIDEYGINQVVTTEDPDNPTVIEFVANKSGTFRIYCKPCWDGPFGRNHPNIQATLIVS